MSKPADRIALDSDAVALSAKKVGSHAEDIRTNHEVTHTALSSALYGCVGNSGGELANLSQHWAASGPRHGDRVDALGRHVGDAGQRLSDDDDANAGMIERMGDRLD